MVYRALDRRLRQEIALKLLRQDRLGPATLRRLEREAAVARKVASPRLVRIYDFEAAGGHFFLTLELTRGGSLSARCSRGPLAIDEVVRLAEDLLEGLTALHAAGLLHRDIKPGNVLFDEQGRARLGDFGLVRSLDGGETRATVDGGVMGTLEYLSPEQALGEELDFRSDLYSLGVVLYESLTGRLPFVARTSLGSVVARFSGRPPDPRTVRPETPPWLAGLIATLLDRRRESRYPDAAAALADLRRRRRRWSAGAAARGLGWVAAGLGIAFLVALFTARGRSEGTLSHVVTDGPSAVRAVSRSGADLWRRDDVRPYANFVPYRTGRQGERRVAAILAGAGDFSEKAMLRLSLLDSASGEALETLDLPSAGNYFEGYSRRWSGEIRVFDLDGDGADELLVTYVHDPYWPSFTVLVEPGIKRSRLLLVAGGHHRPVAAADLDGDGRNEVLFAGISNPLDHLEGMAAVRVEPGVGGDLGRSVGARLAFTPDVEARSGAPDNLLLWYALLPPGTVSQHGAFGVASARRQILFGQPPRAVLDFDGFTPGSGADLPLAERRAVRARAWAALFAAERLELTGAPAEAAEVSESGARAASPAGETVLAELLERRRARALVAAGQLAEGESGFERLLESSFDRAEVSVMAGRAFHLAGDLERAVAWYRRALGREGRHASGRGQGELVTALVAALAERGKWDEAEAELRDYGEAWALDPGDLEMLRQVLSWLRGEPSAPVAPAGGSSAPDLQRYWSLELRLSAGEAAPSLLPAVELELGRVSGEVRPLVESLRAELLARRARRAEALDLAREALAGARVGARREPLLRVHLPLLEERLRSLEGLAPPAGVVRPAASRS